MCIRDLARVGQMLQKGRYNNSQVIPAGVVEDIARGADAKAFEGGGFKTRKGWSYRSQWWVNPNFPRSFGAHGAFGQLLYVFPEHDLVIAKFGSHPNPLSSVTDPVHFQAFAALIQHLQLSVK
ncbi:MAG: serine hydrolase [Betaproteobacteria bacterium]|nr:serine hydrolase [Betaproteobacteria bacterium]